MPKKYATHSFAYGFQKGSPYKGLFNHYLATMTERGPLNRIIQKYAPNPQICPSNEGKALGLENLVSAFMVVILGIFLALVILTLEIMICKIKAFMVHVSQTWDFVRSI